MKKRGRQLAADRFVLQLLIVLPGTDPLVWRRIQVPDDYSFWDLHVAIQDAMGWDDAHLHEFTLIDPKSRRLKRIGIPDDELPDERPCLTGWRVRIARYLWHGVDPVRYRYDFGDDWQHSLEFEDLVSNDGGAYPRCLDGAGACPPEDVGGLHGYQAFLRIVADPHHPEHERMLDWVGGSFDPHAFRADSIEFDDPSGRFEAAFRPE